MRGVERFVAALGVIVAFAVCLPTAVAAQLDYEAPSESPFSIRALADIRFVSTGRAPSWTDRGPAKTRYGGRFDDGGIERTYRFALSQLAIELGAAAPAGIDFHAQLNWEADVDDEGDISNDGWPRVIEAFGRREWGDWERGWGMQAGVMNAPLSLEQSGPAWTSPYTLTPSALNSWLWEEVRIIGLEGERWWGWGENGRLGFLGGLGWGPDNLGQLLSERGFVLSDYLSGVNSDLPLPKAGADTAVFHERDGRPAVYAVASVRDPWELGELRAGYFDNLAEQSEEYGWQTRFGSAGVTLRPLPMVDLVFQYMHGSIATRVNDWDSDFTAWFPLLSLHYKRHRVSVRYDSFEVDDHDGAPLSSESGEAWTVAYLYELGLRHRFAFEYILPDSHRPHGSNPDPPDDSWQISYRYRY